MKKKLMKKTVAAVLALSLVGGAVPAANRAVFSFSNTVVAADEADADQSWFDEKTSTLHLKGSIVNQVNNEKQSDGIKLPEGVEKEAVLHVVVDESAVFPENCMSLFGSIGNVESIDLTGADTSNVTNMAKMFAPTWLADVAKLTPLKSIYFGEDFNTSKVTDMHGMFTKQDSLTELDLSSFNTSNVKDMKEMFILCTTLKRIFVSDSWTTDAIPKYGAPDYNRGDMNVFMGSVNLMGGNGTTYDYEKSNGDRAMIDKVAQTGYLTQAPTYLSEPKYKQTADNGMIHYIRYIFVVPKSELSGKEKAVITAEYNGVNRRDTTLEVLIMSRRRRNETDEQRVRRELISDFLSVVNIQSTDDIQELFKESLAGFMEGCLESELDSELGYEPYDVKNWNCQEMCSQRIPKILDRQESGRMMSKLL